MISSSSPLSASSVYSLAAMGGADTLLCSCQAFYLLLLPSVRLSRLELTNFRNYPSLVWEPAPAGNLVLGANGVGKSNLLEAIFLLATGRSFRGAADRDLVQQGADGYGLAANCQNEQESRELRLLYSRGDKRRASIDGRQLSRQSEMVGILKAVVFSSEDITMINGEPVLRRRFLDLWLGQLSPMYLAHLTRAREAVLAKAQALRRVAGSGWDSSQLDVWDATLADEGARVMLRRREAVAKLNKAVKAVYADMGRTEILDVCYRPAGNIGEHGWEEACAALKEEMLQKRTAEIALRQPLVGPSRDEVLITLDGMEIRRKGSRGQQRYVALALKLAIWEMLGEEGKMGVLLLDDPASELDSDRVKGLVERLDGKRQFVLTGMEVPPGWQDRFGMRWEIANGKVQK